VNGALRVARIAPAKKGGAPVNWRLRAHFYVENNSDQVIHIESLTYKYQGGSDPADLTKAIRDTNGEADIDSRDIQPRDTNVYTTDDGTPSKSNNDGTGRALAFPLPTSVEVEVNFSGFSDPISFNSPLALYQTTHPLGGYLFPAKQKDLKAGEYWSTGIHAWSRTQKFGYDFQVARWSAKKNRWTTLTKAGEQNEADGKQLVNEDFLVFNKPVYAMADGVVMKCFKSVAAENVYPNEGNIGQNHFWIRHTGGEYALYGHLRVGTVSDELCPVEDTWGMNGQVINVSAGQMLARSGNNGSSTGPHLHMHLELGDDESAFGEHGVPLYFRGSDARGSAKVGTMPKSITDWKRLNGAMPARGYNLIRPNPISFGS
jgi:hypothetical protein